MDLTKEMKLKNFQLALSMVGVTANLMTCDLIHALAAAVDEKGEDFSLRDATKLQAEIQEKYLPKRPAPMPLPLPPQEKEKEILGPDSFGGEDFPAPKV